MGSVSRTAVQICEHFARKLNVVVQLIGQIEKAGEIQEGNGHTLAAVMRGRCFQAHYGGMNLDVGGVVVAQGGKGGGDVESEKMAGLEGDWIQGEKIDTAQAEIPENSLPLVKFA